MERKIPNKPNVIFFMVDQMGAKWLEAIATGLCSRAHGLIMNGYALNPSIPTFMQALQREGWRTGAFGKLHLRPHHESLRHDWHVCDLPNLKRLQSMGVTFTNAFIQQPGLLSCPGGHSGPPEKIPAPVPAEWLNDADAPEYFRKMARVLHGESDTSLDERFGCSRFRRSAMADLTASFFADITHLDEQLGRVMETF